jgi:hypothetical protein
VTPAVEKRAPADGEMTPGARSWSPALQAPLLAVDEGILPSWAYGVGIAAGIRASRLQVMLSGLLWLSQSGFDASPYGATYTRRSAEVSGCYTWPRGSFDVGPCLALTLEDVTARGTGPAIVGGPGHASWLTVGLAARAAWAMRRWAAFFVRPSLAFTTSRPTFAIDGVGPVYHVPLAAVGIDIGCEWIL